MSKKTINEDELVGYILRKTKDSNLYYEDVRAVLDAEMEFLKSKEIAIVEDEFIEDFYDNVNFKPEGSV